MKKISIIGTVGIPAKYGGFETLTEYMTKNLSTKYDMNVYCSAKSYDGRKGVRVQLLTFSCYNLHKRGNYGKKNEN